MPAEVAGKRPEPSDFGLTAEEIGQAKRLEERSHGEPGLGWMDDLLGGLVDNLGWVGGVIGYLLVFTILWPFLLIGLLLGPLLQKLPHTPDPHLLKYRSYLAAAAAFEKAEAERDRHNQPVHSIGAGSH